MREGLPSDHVVNLHTDHPSELGPNGENWNSLFHHSFHIVFQRTRKEATTVTTIDATKLQSLPHEEPSQVIDFGPFSHQDLINAFALAANTLHLNNPWALLTKCGLSVQELATDRRARYAGVALHELPNLTPAEKNLLVQQLANVLATMPVPPHLDPTTEPTPAPIVPPKPEPLVPPVTTQRGNRLGFYLHLSTDQNNLWEAIQRVQPPVILIHADTANRMLLEEIRRFRAPKAFVIARIYKDGNLQRQMIDNDNPEAHGAGLAQEILDYNFGLTTQRGENGHLLIDAWMSLNETVPGPASRQFREQPQETARLLHNYDRFQVAFRQRLQTAGVEAVAFNFGAGNFGEAAHYLDHFPGTLNEYRYLGFHEYGWPTLNPAPGSATSAGSYRRCMEGIRARYGDQHRVIISEAGLTRMYQNASWGDKGWLNPDQTLSEEQYWQSLAWYNDHMLHDPYVLGACLYEVGHAGDWESFRHLGADNQGQTIHLIDRIVTLQESTRAAAPSAAAAPALAPSAHPLAPKRLKIAGVVTLDGKPLAAATVRLIGSAETVGALPGAALNAIGYVTWTRRLTGFSGSIWNCWAKEAANQVAGMSWQEFKSLVGSYNPRLASDGGQLHAARTYFLPENKNGTAEIAWDRPLAGFTGNLWQCWQRFVANRVVGLTYRQFKRAMLQHNPRLAAEHGRLQAGARYNLPRNAGHTDYVIQTLTDRHGRFTFADLLPGSYQVDVRAEDALPFDAGFSCIEDVPLDIVLRPKTLPAVAAMPAAMPQASAAAIGVGHPGVGVNGDEFVVAGRAFRFIGVNIRGLVHYGDLKALEHSRENHRLEQLQAAYDMGARVVRVFLPCMHVLVGDTIARLHTVVNLVRERFPGLYILPAFANLYGNVPFRIRGDEKFYDKSLDPDYDLLNAEFFTSKYDENFMPFVRQVVPAFRDEPIIFAWEIGNELKLNPKSGPQAGDPHLTAFLKFMRTAAQEIRNLDTRHLITTGMISTRHAWLDQNGLGKQLNSDPLFNFLTVHCYSQEYENDDSKLAQELNKPYIIEEAGFDSEKFGDDRSPLTRDDMDRWFGRNARGYMPWGFMATQIDMGDGEDKLGFDRSLPLHHDWDKLYELFQSKAADLSKLNLPLTPVEVTPPEPPSPLPSDDFVKGETVYCLAPDGVNLRHSPGNLGKPSTDYIVTLGFRSALTVTGRSEKKDALTWWPVHCMMADGRAIEGWVAETTTSLRLLGRTQPVVPKAAAAMPISLKPVARATAALSTFAPGQTIYAMVYVNMRQDPGYIGKPDDHVIGQIPHGAPIAVLVGPAQVDALTWWQVRAPLSDDRVAIGWVAEADGSGVRLLEGERPAPPLPFSGRVFGDPFRVGDAVYMVANQANIRRTAGYMGQPASHVLSNVNRGAILTVAAGPQMVDELEWWQGTVSHPVIGWMALTGQDGMRILTRQSTAQSIRVARPFRGSWLMTQGWGSWPEFYRGFEYDGVPLKGHNGLDFGMPIGTPVLATDDGEVIKVDFEPDGFGNHLLLRHVWGESLYAHMKQIDVGVGAHVLGGQPLGPSGDSGKCFGAHLHFGIRIFPYRRTDGWGGFVNPVPFMKLEDLLFPPANAAAFPTQAARPTPMATELPGRSRP